MSAVIFDLGGETAKIGLSTEDVPGLLACTKHHEGAFFSNGVDMSSQQKLELYGWKHCWKDGVASFIDEPGFEDGGGMESLIRYGYQERGVDPEGSTAHICIPPHVINIGEEAGDDHLENFGELFFEKLGVDTLSIADKCMMCLVGTGKTSGIVVEVGADMTFVNSYVEGGTNEIIAGPWNVSLNLGGTVQTLMMTKLHHGDLSDYVTGIDTGGGAGRTFSGIPNTLMAHFKHTHGYCELDADAILARHQTASYDEKGAGTCSADCPKETYTMPDGQEVHIDYPLFIGGEVLFYPEITVDRFSEDTQPITIGNVMGDGDGKGERFCDYVCEGVGVHKLFMDTMLQSNAWVDDAEASKMLWENTVLTGGGTLTKNFRERFIQEVATLSDGAFPELNPEVNPSRVYATYIGRQMLCGLSDSDQGLVPEMTKAEYDEVGGAGLRKKMQPTHAGFDWAGLVDADAEGKE